MGRRAAEFANLNTTSPGKLNTIEWEIPQVHSHLRQYGSYGYCVGLIGTGEQALRHLRQYCRSGIYDDSRHIFVDRSKKVVESLKDWAREYGQFRGQIVKGYLENVVRRMWKDGYQIDLIDYDGVGNLTKAIEDLILEAGKQGVKAFTLVLSRRCGKQKEGDYLKIWQKKLSIPVEKWNYRTRKFSFPLETVQRRAVEAIAKKAGFTVAERPYLGRNGYSPMTSFVLLST